MKIKLYIAKHYWDENQSAKWELFDKFDKDIFDKLKGRYSSLTKEKKKYIFLNNRTIFLLYNEKKSPLKNRENSSKAKSSKWEDTRSMSEMIALVPDCEIKESDKFYEKLMEDKSNLFDHDLQKEYALLVEKSLVACDNIFASTMKLAIKTSIILLFFGLLLYALFYFNIYEQVFIKKENGNIIDKKTAIQTWKWDSYCKENNKYNKVTLCYQVFTKQKCENKGNSILNYSTFIEQTDSDYCTIQKNQKNRNINYNIFNDDQDLPEGLERKFFSDRKANASSNVVTLEFDDFIESWNSKIYNIEHTNSFMNINFLKYKIQRNPKRTIDSYLSTNKNQIRLLRNSLLSSKNSMIYTPLQQWMDKKLKLSDIQNKSILNSNQLMSYVAKIVNPTKPFSAKTIDDIVQLNEFYYYFEKQKKNLYRDGYSKNIKSSLDILEVIRNDDTISGKNRAKIIKLSDN